MATIQKIVSLSCESPGVGIPCATGIGERQARPRRAANTTPNSRATAPEAKHRGQNRQRHIRIDVDLWKRLEGVAAERDTTANRLFAERGAQWLGYRDWPNTDARLEVARASLFAAQAIVRDMVATGREAEIENIGRYVAAIVPDAAWHGDDSPPPHMPHRGSGTDR